MSVTVNNSPIQDHNHEMTHGFKPFTALKNFIVGSSTCQRCWNGEEGGALSLLSGQISSIDGLPLFHSRSFKARSFSEHFIVRLLHCFSVKCEVCFFGFWRIHTSNALVSACGLKTCEKFWLYCVTTWLLSTTIWLGTIWRWNKVNGYHSDHWPSVWHHTYELGQTEKAIFL